MHRSRIMAAVGAMVLLSACGGSDDSDEATAESGAGGGMTLSITAPEDGAEVDVPFTVEFDSSEELGPTEEGVHHVHIFWDGDDSEYTVVEADSFEITDPPEGEHTLNASLRNADHSPAGVETEITVTVGSGSGTDDGADDDGGIDY